jgi:carbonic anhydrase/acetyltransferase-like protein (isoleucine patch superfamily)
MSARLPFYRFGMSKWFAAWMRRGASSRPNVAEPEALVHRGGGEANRRGGLQIVNGVALIVLARRAIMGVVHLRRFIVIRSFKGKTPKIADSSFISEAAYIIGDVEIGENSNVWPGAVIRADFAAIKIGRYVDIEDNCTLHAGNDMEIGDNVIVGHGAVVHSRKVGSKVLIGMNATTLHNSEIGDHCIIAAGSVVTEGMIVPSDSFVVGIPGKVKGRVSEKQKGWMEGHENFYPDLAKQYKEQGL